MIALRGELARKVQEEVANGISLIALSNRSVLGTIDLEPFGARLEPVDGFGHTDVSWDVEKLALVYNRLNGAAFGSEAMAMGLWVQIDLAMVPSALVLACATREHADALHASDDLAEWRRRGLGMVLSRVDELGYDGPIPIAGYCATPTAVTGRWVGWSSVSLRGGLGELTKGLALEAYGATSLVGVSQYDNDALKLHRKFGAMTLVAPHVAWHNRPHTLIYETTVWHDEDAGATPTRWLRADDTDAQQQLQSDVQSGQVVRVLDPAQSREPDTDHLRVPILEVSR